MTINEATIMTARDCYQHIATVQFSRLLLFLCYWIPVWFYGGCYTFSVCNQDPLGSLIFLIVIQLWLNYSCWKSKAESSLRCKIQCLHVKSCSLILNWINSHGWWHANRGGGGGGVLLGVRDKEDQTGTGATEAGGSGKPPTVTINPNISFFSLHV